MSFGARALIRLGAISHNLNVIKQRAPESPVMAVVKANAYGHGLAVVATALRDVDSLAVARLPEAETLRSAGVELPIVLLSGVSSEAELRTACAIGCELVVHCDEQLRMLEDSAGIDATVWLKVDTGMHRLGISIDAASRAIDRAGNSSAVRELRLMTHLANADDTADSRTDIQLERFTEVASGFEGDVSIANSGGVFGWPAAIRPEYQQSKYRSWIRPGIALYGVSPYPDINGADLGLQPVMQFESRLIAVKRVRKGERVGYGGHWIAGEDSVLGIVAAGYGDGYTRSLPSGTPVLVNGRKVAIAGAVSMDMTAVDLGPGASDRVGDEVLLWGDELPVEEIARQAGAIAYQLVCGVMNREASAIVG